MTGIGYEAFYSCTKLTSVMLGNNLKTIYDYAFRDCTSLKNITLPDSLTTIGGGAFCNCTDLTSIIIPNRVNCIGDFAFYWCTSIKSITILRKGDIEIGSEGTFEHCPNLTIYGVKSSGTEIYAHKYHIPFVELKELENNSELNTNQIVLGQTVTINAKADGGTGNYEYEIAYKTTDTLGWETLQDYSANTNVNFKPAKAGTYNIRVNVRDDNGTITMKDFSLEVNMTALENLSSLSAENITLGDTVNINAAAKGGTGEYKYQIVYKKNSAEKWSTIQAYNVNSAVTFKLSSAGTYDVCVKVKDTSNTEVKKFFTLYVADNKLKNYSTISASSIELGESVIVNAKATGSTGFYQYAFYYKKAADTKWTTKQGFKANSIVTIKPSKATTYDICVKIKDNKGTVVKKYFTLEVTEKANKLSNISALSDTEIALGEKITVSASANGSTGFYQYAVSYKNTNDTDWTTVQDYSANSIVSVKPTIVGSYSICVSVKDDFNNKADKYFIVTVN